MQSVIRSVEIEDRLSFGIVLGRVLGREVRDRNHEVRARQKVWL
jgi:hypothetical protein